MRVLLSLFVLLGTAACNLSRATPAPPATTAPQTATETRISRTAIPTITPMDLSSPTPGAVCGAPPSGWVAYVVLPGDTLGDLAAATGRTTLELAQANCLAEPYILIAGQTIYLPSELVVG
ncbi:MAG: LysM peptidoglycan-binding domain-containing protein [Anaerolineae bacterium]|nr:LysM peptidoglycan-binding domain-containing protein [Anaerolineae bacterium]